MVGNPKLAEMGFGEEAHGHNAIAAGFQGQRQWTDYQPNGDFLEAILNTSFDWNGIRAPYIVATENDCLNGASMLFGHLLTNTAQIFADVRTYWSRRFREARLRPQARPARRRMAFCISSIPARPRSTAPASNRRDGKPAMKPFWEITKDEAQKCLDATTWHPSITEYFPGGGWSTRFLTRGGMPVTMCRLNLVKGLGPALQIAEGCTVDLPEKVHDALDQRTNPTWPTTWFAPNAHRPRRVPRCLYRDEQLGREPRRDQLRPHRRGFDFARGDAADSGLYAQRRERPRFSVRALGRRSARNVWKAPTTAPAPISARFTRELEFPC